MSVALPSLVPSADCQVPLGPVVCEISRLSGQTWPSRAPGKSPSPWGSAFFPATIVHRRMQRSFNAQRFARCLSELVECEFCSVETLIVCLVAGNFYSLVADFTEAVGYMVPI